MEALSSDVNNVFIFGMQSDQCMEPNGEHYHWDYFVWSWKHVHRLEIHAENKQGPYWCFHAIHIYVHNLCTANLHFTIIKITPKIAGLGMHVIEQIKPTSYKLQVYD